MVKITFKNVNQGDSIILEWDNHSKLNYAIIDCNNYNSSINPVLEHIKSKKIKEIDFALMTHPHKDHYSGFFELLSYCKKYNIKINRFLHTSRIISEYLKFASRTFEEKKLITKLFKLLLEMKDGGYISHIACVEDNGLTKELDGEYKLEFLAPSSDEFDAFIKSGSYGFGLSNEKKFDGNLLSTQIRIFNDDSMILLTSDLDFTVFDRLLKRFRKEKEVRKMLLGQISHHGSIDNFNKKFWSGIKKNKKTFAVISVGENNYNHPSEEVITFFKSNNNYILNKTNSYQKPLSSNALISSQLLDVFSNKQKNVTSKEVEKGDITFEISKSYCNLV